LIFLTVAVPWGSAAAAAEIDTAHYNAVLEDLLVIARLRVSDSVLLKMHRLGLLERSRMGRRRGKRRWPACLSERAVPILA
jgi:hypothetical protein